MTAPAPVPPEVTVRPLDERAERPYVWSTARKATSMAYGGPHAHWPTIIRLVDGILATCTITVAFITGDPDIMGYVARAPDRAVEFLYLRKSLLDEGRLRRLRATLDDRRLTDVERDELRGDIAGELRVAHLVARALLQERMVILRRPAPPRVMDVVLTAGYSLTVIPGAV
jgi:hypothetical protein